MRNFDFKGFRNDFKEVVKELEKKYNIEMNLGNISYDDVSFNTKLSVVSLEGGDSKEEVEFKKECKWYGYTESDYKRKVKINNGIGEFIGFIPKGKKYKYIVKQGDSKYKVAELHFVDEK